MKKMIIGITLGLCLGLSLSAMANGIWEKIDVLRNDVQVVVNGVGVTADNFLYNDTTYLPLRAVGEALDLNVQYDEETKTAILVERTDDMNGTVIQDTTSSPHQVRVYTSDGLAGDLGYPYVEIWDVQKYGWSLGLNGLLPVRDDEEGNTTTLYQNYRDENGVLKMRTLIANMPSFGDTISEEYWLNTLKPLLDNMAAHQNQE